MTKLRNSSPLAASSLIGLAALLLSGSSALGYPLDGEARSGIGRLAGYRAVQEGKTSGMKLPPGALLGVDEIALHLTGAGRDLDIVGTPQDPALKAALDSIFAGRDPSYSVAVLDFSDPAHLRWAAVRESRTQYPGSVGKTVTMVAFFDALARAFPTIADRERLLREHVVQADAWVNSDSHSVPRFDAESGRNKHSIIQPGDRFRLAEWVDHMMSPSANAAGAMLWKQAMLLRHFGAAYPVPAEQETEFFSKTPKTQLQILSLAVSEDALKAAGLDTKAIRQGSLWTRHGKSIVPGVKSYASPHELTRLLLRIEQGRLVDPWSSLEMKRYLYFTKKRYRYAYPAELKDAAVYFKSGSLYSCVEEEGFRCGKYKGNVKNYMNSIAIVESPARPKEGEVQRRYAVALLSNVLRQNSAWDHARLAAAIEEAVRTRSKVAVVETESSAAVREAGESD